MLLEAKLMVILRISLDARTTQGWVQVVGRELPTYRRPLSQVLPGRKLVCEGSNEDKHFPKAQRADKQGAEFNHNSVAQLQL